jgi:hypothetical protein
MDREQMAENSPKRQPMPEIILELAHVSQLVDFPVVAQATFQAHSSGGSARGSLQAQLPAGVAGRRFPSLTLARERNRERKERNERKRFRSFRSW